jgi:single-strand DNA-binding protein
MSRHIVTEGNLTRPPRGGHGHAGKSWAHLDIAVTDRTQDADGAWTDGPVTYYRIAAFGRPAENALDSLDKGERVLVAGQLTVQAYQRGDGTTGVANEIIAEHLGASLTHNTVSVTPNTNGAGRRAEPTDQPSGHA